MTYLSIKEATEQTGKNEKTIRRLIKKAESKKFVKVNEGKLFINSDYLYNIYQPIQLSTQQHGQVSTQTPGQVSTQETGHVVHPQNTDNKVYDEGYYKAIIQGKEDAIKILTNQVDSMSRQIDNKDVTINQLIERNREQNIIIQSIQEKIAKQLPNAVDQNPTKTQNSTLHPKANIYSKIDILLIGVATLTTLSLIGFIGLMILAYINR